MPITIKKESFFSTEILKTLNEQFNSGDRADPNNITVHVSDLISWCLRKAIMQRTHPYLYYLTETDLNNFTRGKLSELAISDRMKELADSQRHVHFEGILGRPDVIYRDNSVILELKDYNGFDLVSPFNDSDIPNPYAKAMEILKDEKDKRKQTRKKKYNSFPGYMCQLLVYMVFTGIEKGVVVIRHNNHKFIMKINEKNNNISANPFQEWAIYLPKDDPIRDKIKENLLIKKHFFVKAIQDKNIKLMPRVKEFYDPENGLAENSKCKNCCFKQECHKPENDETMPDYIKVLLDPLYIYNEFKNEIKIEN